MNNHYRGFIETCVSYGMDKSAAGMLYKQAGIGSLAKGTGRIAAKGAGGVKDFAKGTGKVIGTVYDASGRALKTTATAIENAANATGEAIHNVAKDIRAGWREGINEARIAKGLEPLPEVVSPASAATRGFTFKKLFHPARALGWFIKKHPYASTLASGVLAAYLTNKANKSEDNDYKSKLPTLTPSEKMLLDRSSSGMDLPGLGLDPRFFNGSYYDSYLYM